ncbi:N-formylglutamate amidohydrolase [Pseudochrobactrum sp. HB0163]|uniref:N-formylglutamate amidohydrolase n=1 Tax=Pseudochrobactrum sp. HB0163 TaxID=3450708 RepID=UPI003F6DE795
MTDFSPFEIINGNPAQGLLLIADHASRAVPQEYGTLGLKQQVFERHIAYDIGVEMLTRQIAQKLDAPAVLGGFSRLLIDPNRGEDDPTLIMQLSDGEIIPANYPMDESERENRLNRFYRPYHHAVSEACGAVAAASGKAPFVVSVHSYTPVWKTTPRPWHIALLWDKDDRGVALFLSMLRQDDKLIVGDNEPYDGALRNDTLFRHCTAKGYANVLIEVRQDLIATPEGVAEWAQRLAPMLCSVNNLDGIHDICRYGSRTGPVEPL